MDDTILGSFIRGFSQQTATPFEPVSSFSLQSHPPLSRRRTRNVASRCTTCIITPLFRLCGRPNFRSGLQLDMGLGMFRQCGFFGRCGVASCRCAQTDVLFTDIQLYRPKCVHSRRVFDVNM